MKSRNLKIIISALLILASSFYFLDSVFAEDPSSTSFKIKDSRTDGTFGGNATSSNFELFNFGGEAIQSGQSTSTNFIIQSGPLDFSGFTPESGNWHWYDDENNETPTSSLADENVAPSNVEDQTVLKLRFTVKEVAGIGSASQKFRLQYSEYSDFSQGLGDVKEQGSCLGNSLWCYADGVDADNDGMTTGLLSDSDSCVAGVGDGCGTHNESGVSTSTFTHQASTSAEYEFTVKASGPLTNTVYFFRAFDVVAGSAVALFGTSTYPSLLTGGTSLEFQISGLAAGTSTEGITTDVTSTPTSIPFGNLAFGNEVKAAQRLLVTTNATEGYQIFVLERQSFINDQADQISPVDATNVSPAAWASACTATSSGCYGYHAGDDTLFGGSTRFSPNDTYAKFEGDIREIAYSSSPVASDTTDMIFKTQVTNRQEPGSYSSSILYIVVPTF